MFATKVLLIALAATLTAAELMQGYHGPTGIPSAARIKEQETSRIVGGIAVPLGVYPYFAGLLVTLTTGQTSVCGGTLISSRRVLTAAQCWFDGFFQGRAITVVLGSNRLYTGGTRIAANAVYVHPDYKPARHSHDLAVLAVPVVALNNNIAVARLPLPNSTYVGAGHYANAVGFGKMSDWAAIGTDQPLNAVSVPVITNAQCSTQLGTIITNDIICTSGNNGWGVCGGDAGGPLVIRSDVNGSYAFIGVIIGPAPNGCHAGLPSMYTRVGSYVNWINSLLN